MSSWVALNIEPDEDSEEEVDDTKEIQIEEALKLYQNALKLHSQGPQFYPQAAEAYIALFKSEIFNYPESISDYKRTSLEKDALPEQVDILDEVVAETGAYDINETSSTLLQTIYLSYKNYGQFLLDSLKDSLQKTSEDNDEARPISVDDIATKSKTALGMFAEALERDDTDLDLWRKTARIGGALQSYRLTRFGLESVLEDEDEELKARTAQLGLEEAFAMEDLRGTLLNLDDKLSLSQIPSKKPRKALLKLLRSQIDLYPYLPALSREVSSTDPKRRPLALSPIRQSISPTDKTWTAVGKALLQIIMDEDQGNSHLGPGAAIEIQLPAGEEPSVTVSIEDPSGTMASETQTKAETDGKDIEMLENNETQRPESPVATKAQDANDMETVEDHSSIDQRAETQLRESLEGQSGQLNEDTAPPEEPADEAESKSAPLPSRKRSSGSFGNDDAGESGRAKSRRTRARESIVEATQQADEVPFDQEKYYEDRLEIFSHADQWMFGTVGSLLSKVGVEDLGSIDELKSKVCLFKDRKESTNLVATKSDTLETTLYRDLRKALMHWDEERSKAVLQGDSSTALQDLRGMNKSGLAIFLEHSRQAIKKPGPDKILSGGDGLSAFVQGVNDEWLPLHEVALSWLQMLLMPEKGKFSADSSVTNGHGWPNTESTYTSFLWPDALKETVVQISIREDEFIYGRMAERIADLEQEILRQSSGGSFGYTLRHYSDMEMIQTLYELHLDVYALINNPNSEVDGGTRIIQKDRLARWGILARTAVNHFMDHGGNGASRTTIGLRHLWSSTFHSNMAEDASRDHILLCLQELRNILSALGNPVITLLNNAVMPEISVAALDQEISRLNSMDFFMMIFGSDSKDPVDLIESIEPILEPSSVQFVGEDEPSNNEAQDVPGSHLQEMSSFLDRGDATLRLFLWRRLQDAYRAIDYSPKVVSCNLRSIETIIKELQSPSRVEIPEEQRQINLLRWLKSIDDVLAKTLTQVLAEPEKSFECIDAEHLQSSMSAIAQLSKLLHSFALYEDSIRVGQLTGPELRGQLSKSLEHFKDKLRDMQVRAWLVQYTLLKEAIAQNREHFDTPADDRVHYLRSVHNALGVRSACRYSNKQLLKVMKSELLTLQTEDNYDSDISQVLFDLHGVKLSAYDGTTDHGCPAEKLDRATAIMMIDFIMAQANRMSIKDLSKSELKPTIEKMQQSIGMTKSSPPLSFNRRVVSAYLKSPINPSHLFRAVQGIGELSMIVVPTESAKIAQKGWYFLLGHAALTKFRSQKRLNPVPTSDLDDAITYFRQDLEHGSGRWESWYRLAQTYDTKLEEDITWSADKINNNRTDLVTLQRNAIHCYAMAVATAIQTAEPTPENRAILSDLYTDFGIRMYSSSREPFSMGAFSLADYTRHFSKEETQQMYKGQPFKEMRLYSVWNFASYLLRRAMADKPKRWMNYYMLSKCLWKMYSCDDAVRGPSKRIEIDDLIDLLLDAIEALPQRKDTRSEPIFEPHYKLVSIVHKLVRRSVLKPVEASNTLTVTPWARKVSPPAEDIEAWQPYILEVLKNLRNADKSNWHHRIVARTAHILYDDRKDESAAASAKHELTQQIFTKTMTLQVWKPEYERPGRHFVYTTRYVYFFVSLLDQLNDRASLEQLLRRVRKKQGDFINHTKLWEDICLVYTKLIRRAAGISEGHEEGIFRPLTWDEFVTNTARLDALPQLPTTCMTLLELIRDAVELKKLNNNLMKVTILEDLVADLYARLYEVNVPHFVEQANEESKEKMKVDHVLMTTDGAADTPTPPTSAPPSEAPAPRGRTKGIARRDVQKRAEAIVNRMVPRAALPKPAAATEGEATRQPAPTIQTTAPISNRDGAREGTEQKGPRRSIPGSLHDSADDESELSEIDEERLSKLNAEHKDLLFPNLNGRSPDPTSELSGVDGEDGDDGEGEGEEGEGEDEEGDEGADEGDGDADEAEAEGEGEQAEEGAEGEGVTEFDEEGQGEGDGDEEEPEDEDADETELDPNMDEEETEQQDSSQEQGKPGEPEPMDTQTSDA
ncbi:histone transcription regulator 3 [Paecilomyces variotii No. 5]|uniref:Histone transcription regulator 3 homolog n=1 Tax=Byssochlamys spectabilis (strain No. 5 / NBRC 109023) TaxID=1356009 RepID=V5FGF2_BYSSN|nr:histone transcription regulator 3 [Paecilomyces variotii No. 5]